MTEMCYFCKREPAESVCSICKRRVCIQCSSNHNCYPRDSAQRLERALKAALPSAVLATKLKRR